MIGHRHTSPAHPLLVTRDHVIPKRAHGGDDDNLVLCCRACNSVKAAMSPSEWAAFRETVPEWWTLYEKRRTL